MALYQPTNVIPSSYTKGTVDAVNDKMEISLQVNGNSAMTAFQIDFYLNDANSTPVTSTGRLTDNIPTGGFYGTDRFGRPQFFTYNANVTWEDKDFTNGNEYKYKITQFFAAQTNVVACTVSQGLESGEIYYFEIPSGEFQNKYVVFTATDNMSTNSTIYYNFNKAKGWFENGNSFGFLNTTIVRKIPLNGTPIIVDGEPIPPDGKFVIGTISVRVIDYDFLTQNEFNIFKTKDTPQVTIYLSDSQYQTQIDLINGQTISTSIGFFVADYTQNQGDPIRWIRWQVASATYNTETDEWILGEILSDTGEINTSTLQYEFNGFFNGQHYAVRCLTESQSGQSAINTNSPNGGWIFFTIDILQQGEYRGEFTLQCLNKENAALLEWTSEELPPIVTGRYTLKNRAIYLAPNSTLQWAKNGGFALTWTAALSFSLEKSESFTMLGRGGQYSKTFNAQGLINSVSVTDRVNVNSYTTSISPDKKSCTVTIIPLTTIRQSSATIVLNTTPFAPQGEIAKINMGNKNIVVNGILDTNTHQYGLAVNDISISLPSSALGDISLIVSPTNIIGYDNGTHFFNETFTYQQSNIAYVEISGGLSGTNFNCVTIYQGGLNLSLLDELYSTPGFKPSWASTQYSLYMTANFIDGVDGGEVAAFRIYRQEVGTNILFPVLYSKGNILKFKDYGIVSRKAYTYWLYEYDSNNAFLKGVQCKTKNDSQVGVVATCFKNYSLLVCDYDEENDEYHVRKQYLFALNLSTGSVGNNNSPTLNANFTRYPTRMPSTQNYASGTLQGLIGAIYTVPALIEQIGNYKWTAKPSTMDYFDSVDLEQELYNLSTAPYQLFLRDMKGRLRMVATNGAITMTTNIKQKQQSISISFPWVEIGDASDVTIIQTPQDYGWNNDNQVLDVSLDVDVETGELSATYPYPYNGTKFYLTGVNKETLTAKTPFGVTPAQFELSEVAEEPNDGELNATVKVNSEDN